MRKLLRKVDMLIILIVRMVSQANLYVDSYQIVLFRCGEFIGYQLYLNKVA
jgi:hypothetical protein